MLTVEVGFSQPSEELENTIKAHLERTSTKVALMSNFKEFPDYKTSFVDRKAVGRDRTADQKSWPNRENLEILEIFIARDASELVLRPMIRERTAT